MNEVIHTLLLLLLLLFTHIQHIVRAYDSRQSCLLSAEQGDVGSTLTGHLEKHTAVYLPSLFPPLALSKPLYMELPIMT